MNSSIRLLRAFASNTKHIFTNQNAVRPFHTTNLLQVEEETTVVQKPKRHSDLLNRKPKVALLLTGCGFLDGTDTIEAVSFNLHCKRLGFDVMYFAPVGETEEIYNHVTRDLDSKEERDMLKESARIATPIHNLIKLKSSDYDVLLIPGGLGWFRNVSNIEREKNDMRETKLNKDVERVIKDFHKQSKLIVTSSYAAAGPAFALAKKRGGPGINFALGKEFNYVELLEALGNKHTEVAYDKAVYDEANRILSTPGFAGGSNVQVHSIYNALGDVADKIYDFVSSDIGTK